MLEVKRAKKDGMGFNSIALTRNSLSDFCTCNYVPFFFGLVQFVLSGGKHVQASRFAGEKPSGGTPI